MQLFLSKVLLSHEIHILHSGHNRFLHAVVSLGISFLLLLAMAATAKEWSALFSCFLKIIHHSWGRQSICLL
jgi:hypothetical protein